MYCEVEFNGVHCVLELLWDLYSCKVITCYIKCSIICLIGMV